MKITLKFQDGTTKEVEFKEPTRKVSKQIWKYLMKFDKGDVANSDEYLEFLETKACELTGLTPEELENLSTKESNKIIEPIVQSAIDLLGFTKLSSQLEGSGLKARQG